MAKNSSSGSKMFKKQDSKCPINDEELSVLLCFSDVLENLHEFKELDIVPKQFVDYIKEDKTKVRTIIEYSAGLVAVIDRSLLIYNESLERYYDTGLEVLQCFRSKLSFSVGGSFRDMLTEYRGDKVEILKSVSSGEAGQSISYSADLFQGGLASGEDIKKKVEKFMYLSDLASRLMMGYNGEFNISYSVRIDLILMNHITDYERELNMLQMIHKRFKKSSIAWHYRKVIFMLVWTINQNRLINQIKTKKEVLPESFKPLFNVWDREHARVEHLAQKHPRSYKIWEYWVFMINYIAEQTHSFFEAFKDNEDLQAKVDNETEIFLIENYISNYEKAKDLVKKNVHNHCSYTLLTHSLFLLTRLKVDEFMGDKDFYKNFFSDHLKWIEEVEKYFEVVYATKEKLKGQTTRKLESMEEHKEQVLNWKDVEKFFLSSSK